MADMSREAFKNIGDGYAVVLPCATEDFTEFISGLLGKAQTIEQTFRGPFEVTRDDIANCFHLVDQRVRQQNEASLVQFTVRIVYDDNSSVLLNDLDSFLHYAEVRALVSTQAFLSWTYLIKFQDKRVPEKQQIEVSIISDPHSHSDVVYGPGIFLPVVRGFISIRVSHTARTWGGDIEALLAGHITTLLRPEQGLKKFLNRYSNYVGICFAALFFVVSIVCAYTTANRFVTQRIAAAKLVQTSSVSGIDSLTAKVNFLLDTAVRGTWPQFALVLSFFLIMSAIIAVVLGVWVGEAASNPPPAFLLLSKQAEEQKKKILLRLERGWKNLALSLITGVLTGVAGNVLFASMFSKSIH